MKLVDIKLRRTGKLVELICEVEGEWLSRASRNLRKYFPHEENWFTWFEEKFGENAYAGNGSYLSLGREPRYWINFDLIYDNEYGGRKRKEFSNEKAAEKAVREFRKWWRETGTYVVDELVKFINEIERMTEETRFVWEDQSFLTLPEPKLPEFESTPQKAMIVIGGKVFEANIYERGDDVAAAIEKIKSEYEHRLELIHKTMKNYKEQLEMQVSRIKKLTRMNVPPWWDPWIALEQGISLGVEEHDEDDEDFYLEILAPITYQPLYVHRDGVYKRIKNPIEPRRVILKLLYDSIKNMITNIKLYDPETKSRFYHYHSVSDGDCTGSLKLPYIHNMNDLIKFIARVEETLKTIDLDDIAHREPADLPHIKKFELEEMEEEEEWM